MRGVNRAAVVVGIVVAGALTLAQARDGEAMTNGLVWGSQKAIQSAQWVVSGMGRAFSGLFFENRAEGAAPASAQRRSGDEPAQQAADFVWHGAVGAGQAIEIKGVNGDIIAERASGGEIEVRAEKRGRRSDPEAVRIVVVEHAGGVTVCAVYPSSGRRENTCEPGSGGRNSTRNNGNRLGTKYHLEEPEHDSLNIITTTGKEESTVPHKPIARFQARCGHGAAKHNGKTAHPEKKSAHKTIYDTVCHIAQHIFRLQESAKQYKTSLHRKYQERGNKGPCEVNRIF